MSKLQIRNGEVVDILWLYEPESKEWHARIRSQKDGPERLTCCGRFELSTFRKELDEPDLTKGDRCQSCAVVLFNIRLM